MPKDTKTLGNNKARAWESLGFAHKKRLCQHFDTTSFLYYIHRRILFRSLFSSRWLFLYFFLVFDGYTSQFRVNHDTSAIFANDDFLT